MAKGLAIALACVGLVSGLWIAVSHYYGEIQAETLNSQSAALKALSVELEGLRRENTLLSGQMDSLLEKLDGLGHRPTFAQSPSGDIEQLAQRITKLETQHNGQSNMMPDPVVLPTSDTIFDRLSAHAAAGKSRPNEQAEALFQSDYGAADDHTSELIVDAFNVANDDLGIQDIQCKSTICKVRYNSATSQAKSLGGHPVADAVLSQLMEGMDAERISAHHARDALGNNLMYIEIR